MYDKIQYNKIKKKKEKKNILVLVFIDACALNWRARNYMCVY